MWCVLSFAAHSGMSYHRIAAQDWSDVSTKLQLHDIPDADMPRLLYECILDLQGWQGKTRGLIKEIEALQTRTEQYRENSVDPLDPQ